MCIFSLPIRAVSRTSIFARPLGGGRQALVYEMTLDANADLAMVLPIPTPPAAPEDAVHFVSLQGYPTFFRDLELAFPEDAISGLLTLGGEPLARHAPLVVHQVGDFEASFVPTLGDLDRLDPRFRLPRAVWTALGGVYDDWGFAVFKLRVLQEGPRPGFFARLFGKKAELVSPGSRAYHPMAFTFPSRDPARTFFPTVHVHDGEVHPTAHFDHALYVQPSAGVDVPGFTRSERPGLYAVDPQRAQGLVELERPVQRRKILGDAPNRDVWV